MHYAPRSVYIRAYIQSDLKQGREYLRDARVVERVYGEQPEMTEKPRVHVLPTAAGRPDCGQQQDVLDVHFARVLQVVPVTVVQVLSQQLDGRLRAVQLFDGHVHVVDEYHAHLARRRSVHAAFAFDQFGRDHFLREIRRRLSRERDERRHVFVQRQFVHHVVFDVKTFARARGTEQQQRFPMADEHVDQVRVSENKGGPISKQIQLIFYAIFFISFVLINKIKITILVRVNK